MFPNNVISCFEISNYLTLCQGLYDPCNCSIAHRRCHSQHPVKNLLYYWNSFCFEKTLGSTLYVVFCRTSTRNSGSSQMCVYILLNIQFHGCYYSNICWACHLNQKSHIWERSMRFIKATFAAFGLSVEMLSSLPGRFLKNWRHIRCCTRIVCCVKMTGMEADKAARFSPKMM